MPCSLLKLQLGPVQEFIAAARSTRDLWSGSYLLSWLMATAIKSLPKDGTTLIYPETSSQPLLQSPIPADGTSLIPNLPNLFVAKLNGSPEQAEKIAKVAENAIQGEWLEIANSVWKIHQNIGIPAHLEKEFRAQTKNFLNIAWQVTPIGEQGYPEAYRDNGWHLDATRQLRTFDPQPTHPESQKTPTEKDSLLGTLNAIKTGSANVQNKYQHLLKHEGDHLSAITLIKRFWHLTHLKEKHNLLTDSNQNPIPSTRGIAARDPHDEQNEDTEAPHGEKYLAAIAFDGDSIGKWIGGKFHKDEQLEEFHTTFSKALSQFALNEAPKITKKHNATLIYAGGDDVLALCPADTALELAHELRTAFQTATAEIATPEASPDASAGIAIAHFKSPLQDLVREAQIAEKRAKNQQDRSAFSITLMKHSGETSHWGGKWDRGAIPLLETLLKARAAKQLPSRFTQLLTQKLTPYLTHQTGISKQQNTITPEQGTELLTAEWLHSLSRQENKSPAQLIETIKTHLETFLAPDPEKPPEFQTNLKSTIGLLNTLAFTARNQEPKTPATTHEHAPATA